MEKKIGPKSKALYSFTTNMKIKTHCRSCNSDQLEMIIDFGLMPLANNLAPTAVQAVEAERFPLSIVQCKACTLLQLTVVVPPEKLFSHYVYRSSMSDGYKKHCRKMAETLKERFGFGVHSFAVDIAGNDGALLNEFRSVMSMPCVNIDPAHNLCNLSQDIGIPAKKKFWGLETAKWLLEPERQAARFTHADIITATNVFAHVDDVKDFLAGIDYALSFGGVCIIEFPHVLDFLFRAEFDTIYHEHLSYFGLKSFLAALKDTGLHVFDVEKHTIHGGTLRLYVAKSGAYAISIRVAQMLEMEKILKDLSMIADFKERSRARISKMRDTIKEAAKEEKLIMGFAASAKGNTFLNRLGAQADYISCLIDETPEKIGQYSPGTGIKIRGMEALQEKPDLIINFAWNFKDEIEAKLRAAGYEGEIYHPI